MEFLDQMAQDRFNAIKAFCEDMPRVEIIARLEKARQTISILPKLNAREEVAIIAEFKRSDPLLGELVPEADHVAFARQAQEAGAFMVSCVTEPSEYDGAFEDIHEMSQAVEIPILASDYVVAPEQFPLYRACGADVALIITPITTNVLSTYINFCPQTGLTALVEVRDADELRLALDAGATFIAVNARNIDTGQTNLDLALPVIKAAKDAGALVVAKYGIMSREDVEKAAAAGADAVLIGSPFMTADDPVAFIQSLAGVPRKKARRRTKIRINGLTDVQDADAVAKMGADSMGIFFVEDSPYCLTAEEAAELFAVLPARVARVGIFANNGRVAIEKTIAASGITLAQYDGDETHELVKRTSVDVVKTVRITDAIPEGVENYNHKISYVMLAPQANDVDACIDWKSCGILPEKGFFYVTGGLTVANVKDAIESMHPDGVAYLATQELAPGKKDLAAIEAFIQAVRAADVEVYGA